MDKVSDEEFEIIIIEISERLKDMVYAKARELTRKELKPLKKDILRGYSGDKFKISFSIEFLAGDIQQIVARKRRDGKESQSNAGI